MNPSTIRNPTALVGRVLLAAIFLFSGVGKIADYAGTVGYMASAGLPALLLPPTIALEIVGGLAIVAGWQTRATAFLLAGFTLVSAIIFHRDFADQNQMVHFWKNVAIAGGFLMLVANGAAGWSLDARKKG